MPRPAARPEHASAAVVRVSSSRPRSSACSSTCCADGWLSSLAIRAAFPRAATRNALLRRRRRVRRGQHELEPRTGLAVLVQEATALSLRERLRDREPEARTTVAVARPAGEAVEETRGELGSHAGAVILDVEPE